MNTTGPKLARHQFLIAALFLFSALAVTAQRKTENVIIITLDGARTQEIFSGLDREVFRSADKNFEKSEAYKRFWAETPAQRREKLMPFFWGTLVKSQGSIAGNRELKSSVLTTNKMFFSYPGYSEILTGQAHDDVIHSNGFGQNPYPSVLDFLQSKLKLGANQVVDFSSWDVMNRIATNKPGAFLVNAGYEPYESANKEIADISRTQFQTLSPWPSVRHDYYTFKLALAHMKAYHPRVIHIGLGETDDWAHDKNYERVVDALNLTDGFFAELWSFLQSDAKYRGKTSIIITTDHGRGNTIKDWNDHGEDVPEAQNIWMAFVSPEVSLRGEWQNSETLYQNQVAATLCRFLKLDYSEQNPNAGKPVGKLFAK
ncbi:hypothetical protein BH10ACI2_BH10ACI2_01180 [soil metagenome]